MLSLSPVRILVYLAITISAGMLSCKKEDTSVPNTGSIATPGKRIKTIKMNTNEKVFTFQYDAQNRITKATISYYYGNTVPTTVQNILYTYTGNTIRIKTQYNSEPERPDSAVYVLDDQGRVRKRYGSLFLTQADSVVFTYNSSNYLEIITEYGYHGSPADRLWHRYSYTAAGVLQSIVDSTSTGTKNTWEYDIKLSSMSNTIGRWALLLAQMDGAQGVELGPYSGGDYYLDRFGKMPLYLMQSTLFYTFSYTLTPQGAPGKVILKDINNKTTKLEIAY
jgi:hypothetical protein